jgi:hypothetical protein
MNDDRADPHGNPKSSRWERTLSLAFLLPPTGWILAFVIGYALAESEQPRFLMVLTTLVAFVCCIIAGWLGWRGLDDARHAPNAFEDERRVRVEFLSLGSVALAVYFALVCVAQWITQLGLPWESP